MSIISDNNISQIRNEFTKSTLSESNLNSDPFQQFNAWLSAYQTFLPNEPTAMTLATVDEKSQPWQRTLLLKGVDEKGFVFFSNKRSHKGQQINHNDQGSLHFFWSVLEQQIHIQGKVEAITEQESDVYFHSRPHESQLAALASQQSQPLKNRDVLEDTFHSLQQKFPNNTPIPKPSYWGGYRLIPTRIEFWQGGEYRLHDRFEYVKKQGIWKIQRLYP
jgi:pyridoxamine 5'-phosphate oxidase